MKRIVSLMFFVLVSLVATVATAQNLPERGEVRKGNRAFEAGDFVKAAECYAKAAAYAPQSFEANYNYSNGLQKSEEFAKSEEVMAKIVADTLLSRADRADGFFNLGNSQFHQQKYKEALESYKSSMRLNPTDTTAKYNYAYTKRLLEDQQNQQDQDQNQDQNEDNKDQNQDQNQDKGDQDQDQQDKGDQDQDQGDQDQDQNQDQGEQEQEGGMSDQAQQQILDAIQAQEDKTQDKLQKEKGRGILVPGGKNW
ncbi:MAG: tetratricopeptide repeat protein [Rikenellaceae bacterium]